MQYPIQHLHNNVFSLDADNKKPSAEAGFWCSSANELTDVRCAAHVLLKYSRDCNATVCFLVVF